MLSKFSLHMFYDHNPVNPRKSDNLSHMVCWHDKYNLGDKHSFKSEKDFLAILMDRENIRSAESGFNISDFENHKSKILQELRNHIPIFPIYLYDGEYPELSLSDERPREKGVFIGYIYMDSQELERNYGAKDFMAIENAMFDALEEFDKYSHYVNGDNYKLQILKDGQEFETISGFTGNIYDDVIPEMRKAASETLEKEGVKSEQINDMFGVDAPQMISDKTYESVPNLDDEEAEEEM